jgi:pimeloyl-ACP methyl ester carboxylesterase
MKKTFFILVIVLLFSSCGDYFLNEEFRGGDWFYLENDGAIMPVWVNGNKQSNTFIIYLHGGPGDTAIILPIFDPFSKLQNDYALVYYEQRGSALAQGNPNSNSFTIKKMVEDLEKLVVLIRYKYNNPTIFLMGHSWGGTLGTAFLVNPVNQMHISGWIEINGGHNLKYGISVHSVEWVIERATEQINQGNDVNHWNKEISWYRNNPDLFNNDNISRHGENVEKLNGYAHDPSKLLDLPMSTLLFFSPYTPFYGLNKISLTSVMWRRLENINFTPEMHKITIPFLSLRGKHDGILPYVLGYEAYENIGSANKYLYIFENSAHMLDFEEPELFVERVKTFVDKYKGI